MKHLSLESLISLLLIIKADMEAAKQILDEMKGSSSTDFRLALHMREEVYKERRMLLDKIFEKGGYEKYEYASKVLCPFFI